MMIIYTPAYSQLQTPHTGSYQPLPNNHVLLDFGHPPILNEYDADDNLIYVASVSSIGGETYRAYKYPFTGTPTTAPDIFVQTKGSQTDISVSWNGATEVDAWTISAGSACGAVSLLTGSHNKTGFETAITLDQAYAYVQAHAMSGSTVLASSLVVQGTSRGNNGTSGDCAGSAVEGVAGSGTSSSSSSNSSSSSSTPSGTATSASASASKSSSATRPRAVLCDVGLALLVLFCFVL